MGAPGGGNGAFAASFLSSVGVAIFCVAFAAGSLGVCGEDEGAELNFPQPAIAMSKEMTIRDRLIRFMGGNVA